jgi:hypothetical protein
MNTFDVSPFIALHKGKRGYARDFYCHSNKRQSEVVQWKKLQAFNVLKTILD